MEMNYLKEFVELAQIGNYTKASQRLHISQSVLSKHMKALESELGISLFIRSKQGIHLSEQGELLYPYASKIMTLKEEYLTKAHAQAQVTLRIATVPAVERLKIGELLAGFVGENPYVTVNIIEGESSLLLSQLQKQECDLAFARGSDDRYPELVHIPYLVEKIACFLPKEHPLASKEAVKISELREETFIGTSDSNLMHHLIYDACVNAGFEPKFVYTDNNGRHTADMIKQGFGIALRNSRNEGMKNYKGICQLLIDPPLETMVYLYYNSRHLLPAGERFIQYVIREKGLI